MNFLIKYGLGAIYTVAGVIISLLLLTCLYYFNIIGDGIFSFLKLFIIIISIFINSFILGTKTSKKGYLEGAKFGMAIILLMIIPTLISGKFMFRVIIYYLIILITAMLGSMIGISRKKTN